MGQVPVCFFFPATAFLLCFSTSKEDDVVIKTKS